MLTAPFRTFAVILPFWRGKSNLAKYNGVNDRVGQTVGLLNYYKNYAKNLPKKPNVCYSDPV
jgi:hypothetical protein